jgi:hypothetical protein
MLTGSVSLSTAKWARRGAALDADQREILRMGLTWQSVNAAIQDLNLKKRKLSCLELALA